MSVETIVSELEREDLIGLRKQWKRHYGAPPRLRSVKLLRHILAWRIQADIYGHLDEHAQKLLRESKPCREPIVAVGTIMIREWRGVRHEVEAAVDCFLYQGKRWNSLSQVARAITGTRWNGRRFFGLSVPQK